MADNLTDILALESRREILAKHNDELYNLAIDAGIIQALQRYNILAFEMAGDHLWPPEWFNDKDLIGVLQSYGGPAQMVINHCCELLDFFKILRAIDDPVKWRREQKESAEERQKKIESYEMWRNIGRNKGENMPEGMEREALWLMVEESKQWKIVDQFAKRGRTSGESAKRGWAVRVVAGLTNNADSAVIARLLTHLG